MRQNHSNNVNEKDEKSRPEIRRGNIDIVVVVILLFYVLGKHLRSCRDGQLT